MSFSSPFRRARVFRPALEVLEDRTVPALVFDPPAFHFGGDSLQQGTSIASDGSSNVYVAGYFVGTMDADPGPGEFLLTSAAGTASFVAKYSALGTLDWAYALSSGNPDLDLDSGNNVYVTGTLKGTATFGSTTLTAQGYSDVFLTKLSSAGVFQWATRYGSAVDTVNNGEFGRGVDVDSAGNVYTTGTVFHDSSGLGSCAAVARHDTNGNLVWLKTTGPGSRAAGIAVSAAGAVWVTGDYAETVDFDPGPGTQNLRSTRITYDAFVLKLNAATGNYAWAGSMGGSGGAYDGYDFGGGVAVDDASGNVYVAGTFSSTSNDFNPGGGKLKLTNAGYLDIYVVKLNASGGFQWGRGMGGSGDDFADEVAVDGTGNVLTTGGFGRQMAIDPNTGFPYATGLGVSADFNPGSAQANLTSAGEYDIFVSQLSNAGNYLWAGGVGSTTGADYGTGLWTAASGSVYTTGRFVGTADFDPGAGMFDLTSANHSNGVPSHDVFVLKLVPSASLQAASGATLTKSATSSQPMGRPFSAGGQGVSDFSNQRLSGRGQATHLGQFVLSGTLEYTGYPGSPIYLSGLVFQAADGSTLLTADAELAFDPITRIATGVLTFTGGTGRFAGASGEVYVAFRFNETLGAFEFEMEGVIDY